jgi:hypothetical protein
MTGPTIRERPEPVVKPRRRRGKALPQKMGRQSLSLTLPDRADCVRPLGECRSPHACASVNRCADTMTAGEDARAFGYGDNGGRMRRQ